MEQGSNPASPRSFRFRGWAQILFTIPICITGAYLIILSLYLIATGAEDVLFMLSLAMFGMGCTAIWFALSYGRIQSIEDKLEKITGQLDQLIGKIERG